MGYAQRDIIVFLLFVHSFPKTKFYMLLFTHKHSFSRLPFYCMTCITNTLRLAPALSVSGAQQSVNLLTPVPLNADLHNGELQHPYHVRAVINNIPASDVYNCERHRAGGKSRVSNTGPTDNEVESLTQ